MGEIKEPAKTYATYATWDTENFVVMAWLVNSMEKDISANYVYYPAAKDLWDNINQMHSDFENHSQVYKLELKLGEIRQGENSIQSIPISSKVYGKIWIFLMTTNGSQLRMGIIIGRW